MRLRFPVHKKLNDGGGEKELKRYGEDVFIVWNEAPNGPGRASMGPIIRFVIGSVIHCCVTLDRLEKTPYTQRACIWTLRSCESFAAPDRWLTQNLFLFKCGKIGEEARKLKMMRVDFPFPAAGSNNSHSHLYTQGK